MRVLKITGADGGLSPAAFLGAECHVIYPDDDASRAQALALVEHEYLRWREMNPTDYQPSALVTSLLEVLSKSSGRRITAGCVALAMCLLDNAGHRMSLENAASVVSEMNYEYGSVGIWRWANGDWSLKKYRALGDVQSIKAAFREYRSVSHILAAGLVATHYMELMQPFDRSTEADACFFSTAMLFQSRLRKVKNFADWNLWHIEKPLPFDVRDYPPFETPQEMVHDMIAPWLKSRSG